MNTIDDVVYGGEQANSKRLPDLSSAETLIVVSDYGGQHKGSRYESFSILIAALDTWLSWEQRRLAIRNTFRIGKRRISYKGLNDRRKREAVGSFLDAADTLSGVCMVFVVDRKIESLFRENGRIDMQDEVLQPYQGYSPADFERLLRIVHFMSFIINGLSHPGQNILWFTDQDNIAANEDRVRMLTAIWGNILSNYLKHDLGQLKCGTTKCDNGTLQIEDLAAIADLAAGATSEMTTLYSANDTMPRSAIVVQPVPTKISSKARYILRWISRTDVPLKRRLLLIDSIPQSTDLRINELCLHGG